MRAIKILSISLTVLVMVAVFVNAQSDESALEVIHTQRMSLVRVTVT